MNQNTPIRSGQTAPLLLAKITPEKNPSEKDITPTTCPFLSVAKISTMTPCKKQPDGLILDFRYTVNEKLCLRCAYNLLFL